MEARTRKFKLQESKNHEKLLKVILQIYKPKYRSRPKINESQITSDTDLASDSSEIIDFEKEFKLRDYQPPKIKAENLAEQDKRTKDARLITNGEFPDLIAEYVIGKLTLSQLKQRYYSKKRNISYFCLDDIQSSLLSSHNTSSKHIRKRRCYKQAESPQKLGSSRNNSNWNFSTKANSVFSVIPKQRKVESQREMSSDSPTSKSDISTRQKRWCSVSKVDESLITDDYRKYRVTNDRRERDVPNMKHGGRLSAKNMHDILVGSLFPDKRTEIDRPETPKIVKDAIVAAKSRLRSYKNSPSIKARPVTSLLSTHRTNVSFNGFEIKDQIYIPDEI